MGGLAFAHHVANALDDLARAVTIGHDVRQQFAQFFRLELAMGKEALTGAGVCDHRAERIVHLVRERGRQLTHEGEASHPRELHALQLMIQLGLLPLADVDARTDVAEEGSVLFKARRPGIEHPAVLTIRRGADDIRL